MTANPAHPSPHKRSTASLSDCVVGGIGDPYGQVYDARDFKRATAIRSFASEWGVGFADVQCRTTYGRWLTRQEQWDAAGMEQWEDEVEDHYDCPACGAPAGQPCDDPLGLIPHAELAHAERVKLVPVEPPAEWEPDEYVPAWTFCRPDNDGALRIFVCEQRPRERTA